MNALPGIPEEFQVLLQNGAAAMYKEMPNGEKRYSLKLPGGTEWILTVAGREGGWQNAHYHGGPDALAGVSKAGIHEHYVVVTGWMAIARFCDDAEDGYHLEVFVLQPNQSVTFEPGETHNIYLPAGAVIHTIKTGNPVGNPDRKMNDWWPHDLLDADSKELSEEDIMQEKLSYPREYINL